MDARHLEMKLLKNVSVLSMAALLLQLVCLLDSPCAHASGQNNAREEKKEKVERTNASLKPQNDIQNRFTINHVRRFHDELQRVSNPDIIIRRTYSFQEHLLPRALRRRSFLRSIWPDPEWIDGDWAPGGENDRRHNDISNLVNTVEEFNSGRVNVSAIKEITTFADNLDGVWAGKNESEAMAQFRTQKRLFELMSGDFKAALSVQEVKAVETQIREYFDLSASEKMNSTFIETSIKQSPLSTAFSQSIYCPETLDRLYGNIRDGRFAQWSQDGSPTVLPEIPTVEDGLFQTFATVSSEMYNNSTILRKGGNDGAMIFFGDAIQSYGKVIDGIIDWHGEFEGGMPPFAVLIVEPTQSSEPSETTQEQEGKKVCSTPSQRYTETTPPPPPPPRAQGNITILAWRGSSPLLDWANNFAISPTLCMSPVAPSVCLLPTMRPLTYVHFTIWQPRAGRT